MASEVQPEWIVPRTFGQFEEEGSEDLNTFYIDVVNLFRDYQIRAGKAETHAETLTTNLSDAEATILRLRQHRDNLQHQLAEATGAPPPPTPPPPLADEAPPPRGTRSERIPDPTMFDGNRATLPCFTLKLKANLRTNANWFLSERAMVDFTVSRLEGKALDIIIFTLTRPLSTSPSSAWPSSSPHSKRPFATQTPSTLPAMNYKHSAKTRATSPPTTCNLLASSVDLDTTRPQNEASWN